MILELFSILHFKEIKQILTVYCFTILSDHIWLNYSIADSQSTCKLTWNAASQNRSEGSWDYERQHYWLHKVMKYTVQNLLTPMQTRYRNILKARISLTTVRIWNRFSADIFGLNDEHFKLKAIFRFFVCVW